MVNPDPRIRIARFVETRPDLFQPPAKLETDEIDDQALEAEIPKTPAKRQPKPKQD